jgi:hypothetical protein
MSQSVLDAVAWQAHACAHLGAPFYAALLNQAREDAGRTGRDHCAAVRAMGSGLIREGAQRRHRPAPVSQPPLPCAQRTRARARRKLSPAGFGWTLPER